MSVNFKCKKLQINLIGDSNSIFFHAEIYSVRIQKILNKMTEM